MHFIVTICTAKRPKMLSAALAHLVKLSIPERGTLCIAVIENDTSAQSLTVVEQFQASSAIPIIYHLEPKLGIPYARNCSIDVANSEKADWIAMIDDDEYADQDWLVKLYAGCRNYDADVATGPVRQVCDGEPPAWWKPVADSRKTTGQLRKDAYTNNVLFHSRLIAHNGLNLRFDETFTSGADDIDFFRRAYDKGARIVSVAEAAVTEVVPTSRLVLSRYLQRNFMVAASNSFFRVKHDGRSVAFRDRFPGIVRRVAIGSILMLSGVCLWLGFKQTGQKFLFRGASSLSKAFGSFSGLIGRRSDYYTQQDGA